MSVIKNGLTGDVALVDKQNRLHVHAFNVGVQLASALQGDAFDLCSGIVNSTSASQECGLLYIKNNETDDMIIAVQFVNLGTALNVTDLGRITFYLNPTGGTLISEGIAAGVLNRRIGDAKTLTADVFKGQAAGKTVSGGSTISFPSGGFAGNNPFVLPPGQTFAMSVTTGVGNTDQDLSVGMYVVKRATVHGVD